MYESNEENNYLTQLNGHYLYGVDQVTFSWIPLSNLMDKEYGDNPYLVDHLIPEYGITCIAGKPKSGKSFIALQLAKNIAEGSPAFGHFETKQANVLLIAKEDHERLLKDRLEKFRTPKELPIIISTDQSVFMDTEIYLNTIITFCHEKNISVVIADSFRRFLKGDENSSQDVTKLHSFFKKLNDAFISVIFIHHHRKGLGENTEALRGSSDIHAMVDSLLTITRGEVEKAIEVSQDALRVDVPIDPFSLSIPTFEENSFEYTYIQSLQSSLTRSAMDEAMLEILDYLSHQNEPVYQTQIIEELINVRKATYKNGTIKCALVQLSKTGRIQPRPSGVRTFYELTRPPSIGQTNNSPDGITKGEL